MTHLHRHKLEEIGLSPAEARVYLSLLQGGPSTAASVASAIGLPRTGVYPTLCSLADRGLVQSSAGYPSKFAAVSPPQAFRALMLQEKQRLAERQQTADELAESLLPLASDGDSDLDESVQVIRTPQVIAQRLHHLQLGAEREVQWFVKSPILNPRPENPAQQKLCRRGILFRCVYERAVLDDPRVEPYLGKWIAAGEQARVYDGELPYKLMVLDSQMVVLTLVKRSGQSSALFVRHESFAKSMNILFESFWSAARPLAPPLTKSARARRRNVMPSLPSQDGRHNHKSLIS